MRKSAAYRKKSGERFGVNLGLNEAEGYRLPTEAEWEYAARAGSKTHFAFGDSITPEIVNYNGEAANELYRQRPVPVGNLGVANAWGLFDLHGNVDELCEDDWHNDYRRAPVDGRAWVDRSNRADIRVSRGGNWDFSAQSSRSAHRGLLAPDARVEYIGFRLARGASGR
jgi:formylglycine-generating enzyme required for sulfatase activity